MSSLYEPITVGAITLKNRVAMAPLTRNRAPGAVPQPITATYYRQRASAGLLISEATAISQQGQGYAHVPGLYAPEQVEGWKAVTAAVHEAGGHIFTQLWHVGRISHVSLQPEGGAPVAPSAIRANAKTYVLNPDGSGEFKPTSEPRALSLEELPGIVADYRRAARAAIDAGFDGIEIHAANGYLLDQFMRSGTNHRSDAYGGSIENRARLLLEVMDAVTNEIGAGRVAIRLSPVTPANDASDPHPQPLFTYVVEQLAGWSLAYLHIVEGATGGDRNYQQGDTPFDYAALKAAYRAAGGKGVWMVNNGYTGEMAEAAVASGAADMVAFGKPFIANPDLVRRLQEKAPLNAWDTATFYGGDEKGYLDYPVLA